MVCAPDSMGLNTLVHRSSRKCRRESSRVHVVPRRRRFVRNPRTSAGDTGAWLHPRAEQCRGSLLLPASQQGTSLTFCPSWSCLIGMKAHVELLHAVSALHQVIEITGRAKRPEFAYEREVTFVRRDLAVVANKVRCFIVDRLAQRQSK